MLSMLPPKPAAMTRGRTDIGAVVTFTGICRADENGAPIAALTLEHYPGMAEEEIARHVEAACARWPLLGVTVIHRYGRIEPGEVIVLVATASSHREAAFSGGFIPDGLSENARPVLEAGGGGDRHRVGGSKNCRRHRRRALDAAAGGAKPRSKLRRGPGDVLTARPLGIGMLRGEVNLELSQGTDSPER